MQALRIIDNNALGNSGLVDCIIDEPDNTRRPVSLATDSNDITGLTFSSSIAELRTSLTMMVWNSPASPSACQDQKPQPRRSREASICATLDKFCSDTNKQNRNKTHNIVVSFLKYDTLLFQTPNITQSSRVGKQDSQTTVLSTDRSSVRIPTRTRTTTTTTTTRRRRMMEIRTRTRTKRITLDS